MYAEQETNYFGYVSFSGILHIAAFVFIAFYAVDFIKKPELPRLIEFEIATVSQEIPKGEQLETPALKIAEQKTVSNEMQSIPDESLVKQKVITRQTSLPSKQVSKHQTKVSKLSADVPSRSQSRAFEPIVAPPLETVELDEAPAVIAAPVFQESMIADDLDKIYQETEKQTMSQLASIKKEAELQAEENTKAHEENLAEIEKQQQQEDNRMAAIVAEQKAAALAAASKQASANKSFGSPEGIRALEDLKQVPGNKRPEYDTDDRFNKRQGEVAFLAYISDAGMPTEFKLIKSTGHRSLDLKTLKVLKTWRFQAGQKGWVEIPFSWDLKGGPQEMGGGLRRKVGQN